jgi:hypothetical protein
VRLLVMFLVRLSRVDIEMHPAQLPHEHGLCCSLLSVPSRAAQHGLRAASSYACVLTATALHDIARRLAAAVRALHAATLNQQVRQELGALLGLGLLQEG